VHGARNMVAGEGNTGEGLDAAWEPPVPYASTIECASSLIQRSRGNGPVKLQQPPGRVAGQVLMPTAHVLDDEAM